ncbi:RidA family protein [Arthrobacter sp. R1-13]
MEKLLTDVGLGLQDVVRCVCYLTDWADFAEMEKIFREVFSVNPPVRATVGVASLARDCKFEAEITATR